MFKQLILIALLFLVSIPAFANEFYFGGGVQGTNMYYRNGTSVYGAYMDDDANGWTPRIQIGRIWINSVAPTNISTDYASVSAIYEYGRWFGGIGGLVVSSQTYELTSRYQFIETLGYNLSFGAILFQHISNGNTGGRNLGVNLLEYEIHF